MAQQARQPRAPGQSPYARKLDKWRQEELRAGKRERPAPDTSSTPHVATAPQAAPAPVADAGKIGTVKWFNAEKGFGFIGPDDGGPDVFVHISQVEHSGLAGLNEGNRVRYEPAPAKQAGKLQAINLRLIG